MSTTPQQQVQLPAAITGKFNLALTESGFQKLADTAAKLELNEENLPKIKEFLDVTRKVEMSVESTHKIGKEPSLTEGRNWDAGKNLFLKNIADIKNPIQTKYTQLCHDVLKRQQEEIKEKARVDAIKNGIESNAVMFAQKIANCTTSAELTIVERNINLEKTYKNKYAEFLPDAIIRFNELNTILASQKISVKKLEEIAAGQLQAKATGDDAKFLALEDQKETVEAQVEETKIVVQETAINQSMNDSGVTVAQTVFPKVTAKRTTWKFEVVNEKEVMKKAPELVVFSIDDEKVKAILKTLKDTGQLDGKTEQIVNGIRYYEEKTF